MRRGEGCPLHGEEVFVDSLEGAVVNVLGEAELGKERELGFAPKMGRDLDKINRLAGRDVTFHDKKDCFARGVLEGIPRRRPSCSSESRPCTAGLYFKSFKIRVHSIFTVCSSATRT